MARTRSRRTRSVRTRLGRTGKEVRLALGQLYATQEALIACEEAGVGLLALLERHTRGDRGELGCHDNAGSMRVRVKSSYPLPTNRIVWLITEPDRTVTLLLLPEEF